MRVGIDVMGGDRPPETIARELAKNLDGQAVLFASKKVCDSVSIDCRVCPETIEMDDDPLLAIRKKRQSSMIQGVEALGRGEIDAFITLGNTGALIGSTKISLGMIEGWSRPALLTLIPSATGQLAVLDVGASVDPSPERYLELVEMGTMFLNNQGLDNPRIGLLNIGVEESKGRKEMQQARKQLSKLDNFVGNVESMDVFRGKVDLLLTDGFTGNIFIKTSEGLATFLLDLFSKHIKLETDTVIKNINSHLTENHYSGATLLGVNGLVLKCHGSAGPLEILRTIEWSRKLLS